MAGIIATAWYCRVVQEGPLAPGLPVMLVARPYPRWTVTLTHGTVSNLAPTLHAYRPDDTGAGSPCSAWHVTRRDRGARCALHTTVNRLIRDSEVPLIAPSVTQEAASAGA